MNIEEARAYCLALPEHLVKSLIRHSYNEVIRKMPRKNGYFNYLCDENPND